MADFRFRLDGLLKLHRHHEDAARRDLAHAQRQVRDAGQSLDAIISARLRADEQVSGEQPAVSVTALQAGHAHGHRLRRLEAASREELSALQALQEQQRQQTLEAHRRTETLQRLHDRCLERYVAELRREEARRTDETGALQAARRALGGEPGGPGRS